VCSRWAWGVQTVLAKVGPLVGKGGAPLLTKAVPKGGGRPAPIESLDEIKPKDKVMVWKVWKV
jgi:hypothetical protein